MFDFKCETCNYQKEALVHRLDVEHQTCPKCVIKTKMVKQVSHSKSNFQFKGNGFYETDFKNK